MVQVREMREAEEEGQRRREKEEEQRRAKAAKAAELKAKIASEIERIRCGNSPEYEQISFMFIKLGIVFSALKLY